MLIFRKFRFRCCLLATAALWATGADVVYAIGPYDARNGDECRAQVNANFDALEAEMRANGNYKGIPVVEDRDREPALAECRKLDAILRYERLSPSLDRLTAALDDLRNDHPNPDAVTQTISADHAAILPMPPSPLRAEYLRKYADYQRYSLLISPPVSVPVTENNRCTDSSGSVSHSDHPCAAGQAQQATPEHLSGENCETLREHAADSRHAYDQAVDALLAGAKQTGDDWRATEDRRRNALSDLRWFTDRARLLGCHIP